MAAGDRGDLSPGAAEVRDRFAADFRHTLWGRPDVRKRWVLRQRNEESVNEIVHELAWPVAASLDRVVPPELLGRTMVGAVLDEFASSSELRETAEKNEEVNWWWLIIGRPVAQMLDWYIRHFRSSAHQHIGEIMHEAHKKWNVPPVDTLRALRSALDLDDGLTKEQRETYFALLEPREDTA